MYDVWQALYVAQVIPPTDLVIMQVEDLQVPELYKTLGIRELFYLVEAQIYFLKALEKAEMLLHVLKGQPIVLQVGNHQIHALAEDLEAGSETLVPK